MSEFQGVKEPDGSLEEVGVEQELCLGCWEMETPDSVVLKEIPQASLKDRPLCLPHISLAGNPAQDPCWRMENWIIFAAQEMPVHAALLPSRGVKKTPVISREGVNTMHSLCWPRRA